MYLRKFLYASSVAELVFKVLAVIFFKPSTVGAFVCWMETVSVREEVVKTRSAIQIPKPSEMSTKRS